MEHSTYPIEELVQKLKERLVNLLQQKLNANQEIRSDAEAKLQYEIHKLHLQRDVEVSEKLKRS